MKIIIDIDTDNSAFDMEHWSYQMKKLMREVQVELLRDYKPNANGNVRDFNGNTVGTYSITNEEK